MEKLEQHFKYVSKFDSDPRNQARELLTEASSGPEAEVCARQGLSVRMSMRMRLEMMLREYLQSVSRTLHCREFLVGRSQACPCIVDVMWNEEVLLTLERECSKCASVWRRFSRQSFSFSCRKSDH